jgi:4-amino-4-deoxy-L-arabinose transferase-like glycosyltransferase
MLSRKAFISALPIFLILLIATLLRFIWLDKIPNAVGGDEIVYLITAKASFLTGHDIYGKWSPVNGLLFQYPRGETQAELPYIIDSFFVGPFPLSLFMAHLPTAIMSVLLVLIIYLIAKELFGKKAGIFAALVASLNPWFIYIGRTAYEATPAMLFYLIGFYVLLKAKGWRILLSFPFFVLAFYAYIATKLIFIPFIFVTLFYCYFFVNNKKYFKQYLTLFVLCSLLIAFFVIALKKFNLYDFQPETDYRTLILHLLIFSAFQDHFLFYQSHLRS